MKASQLDLEEYTIRHRYNVEPGNCQISSTILMISTSYANISESKEYPFLNVRA